MKRAALACLLFCASPAAADVIITTGPHRAPDLQPEASAFDPDNDVVGPFAVIMRSIFAEVLVSRDLAVIGVMRDEPEFALILDTHTPRVVFLRAPRRIDPEDMADAAAGYYMPQLPAADRERHAALLAESNATLLKTNAQLEPERCEASLDPALTQRISATWTAMLARTRYADPSTRINLGDPTVVPDGVYHFMGREASGVAMWPSPRTRPGMLLAVVEALRDYC